MQRGASVRCHPWVQTPPTGDGHPLGDHALARGLLRGATVGSPGAGPTGRPGGACSEHDGIFLYLAPHPSPETTGH